jgi:DnaK suppressor protein
MARDRTRTQVKRLEKERQQKLLELERLREALKSKVDPDTDEGDPDMVEREKVLALVQSLRQKLTAIEHALRQIQEGTYGICQQCGKLINPARLEVLPEATLCVACKTILERRSRVGMATAHF